MTNKSATGVKLLDDPTAPDIFATGAEAFSAPGGICVSITLTSQRYAEGEFQDVTIGRLVMPMGGAQALATGLLNFIASRNAALSEKSSEKTVQ